MVDCGNIRISVVVVRGGTYGETNNKKIRRTLHPVYNHRNIDVPSLKKYIVKQRSDPHLGVENIEDGGAVGDAVQQHGHGDGGHYDHAAVLRTVDTVGRGVAAVLGRRQQRVPAQKEEKKVTVT